ncbi:MAG TPA: AI-2E family transporter [Spirochaetota bacterium]|nr:AI-2E family transporter [Spirochaetota bacterium]HOS32640.1 AI-2E family transporter [Spirochaetota bacterium]HOS56049.1 AI-2E family transporter [Spirochaetota bacterium]HPK61619.1 AI-2E family transporter [Spirochaetota bacterium]HQF78505.1 AI-2E family transporter [Spirochaetota bacterium]
MTNIEDTLKNIFLILCAFFVILILYITHYMSAFLVPIFFGFFVSLMLQPLLIRMSRTKIPTWISTIIVVILSVSLISAFIFLLFVTFQNFLEDFPNLSEAIQKRLLNLLSDVSKLPIVKEYFSEQKLKTSIFELFAKMNFGAYLMLSMSKTISIIKDFLVFIFSLVFIIPGINKISSRISRAYPENSSKINKIISNIIQQIQRYMVVKSVISLITGALTFLICYLFGVRYSILWGSVAFLFNFVPYIGSIIAVILPVTMSLIESSAIIKPVFLLISLTTLQQVLGNLLEPKFQSQSSNLSSIVVFTSLFAWGYIWGVAGIFLAVPLMSALNVICENISVLKPIHYLISIKKRKKKKRGLNATI